VFFVPWRRSGPAGGFGCCTAFGGLRHDQGRPGRPEGTQRRVWRPRNCSDRLPADAERLRKEVADLQAVVNRELGT